jgi:ribose 5-phosphate isomerase B
MKIYIGADHNGYDSKDRLIRDLRQAGHDVVDQGDLTMHADDDYPQFAGRVVNALFSDADREARGILICASGQGMCMAANRFKGIRASLCWNTEEARAARNDDDSNVLCLASKYIKPEDIASVVNTWLATPFAGAARYIRRIKELDELG